MYTGEYNNNTLELMYICSVSSHNYYDFRTCFNRAFPEVTLPKLRKIQGHTVFCKPGFNWQTGLLHFISYSLLRAFIASYTLKYTAVVY